MLLNQHVASAIVNALLLRDVRSRTAQLEQSHAVLAKALKVKDAVLSNTSHELRSPLNGIIGLNEYVLASEKALDPEVQNCMKTTLASAKQLLHLVSDILDMSRIGEGALKLNYETASLHSLVQEVFDVAAFTLATNVRLINAITPSFPEVIVDPARLKQVIFNLTSNAIKFTPEGTVTISSELIDDTRTVAIYVADTGIGIDQSHLDIIFEPFGQVESYDTREYAGAGLGLSITKQLVYLHGGRIDVVSTVGEGTTFQIFIPLKPSDGQSIENRNASDASESRLPQSREQAVSLERSGNQINSKSSQVPFVSSSISKPSSGLNGNVDVAASYHMRISSIGSEMPPRTAQLETVSEEGSTPQKDSADVGDRLDGSGAPDRGTVLASDVKLRKDSLDDEPLRVLAVDDIPLNLKVLSNFLRKDGMEVTTASNGKMLLDMLAGDKWIDYDVIMLDWMMPIMSGIAACRLLRERIPSDLLPVLFLTAKSDPEDLAKGFAAGGTDFAVKPFNRHEIVARTRSLGRFSRRARYRSRDSAPVATKLLSQDSFWKMQSATNTMPMFVLCISSGSQPQHDHPSGIDGPTLLRSFLAHDMVSDSDWMFCEVDDRSVTFLVVTTHLEEVREFLRAALARWAESEMAKTSSGSVRHDKPLITIGIDHRPIRAHLFAERLPMLAAVESPVAHAKVLAQMGTKHEEFVLSESAKAALAG